MSKQLDLKRNINVRGKKYLVSTVDLFVAVEDYPFETMVFQCDDNWEVVNYLDLYCERYKTFKEAIDGHKLVCCQLKDGELELKEGCDI